MSSIHSIIDALGTFLQLQEGTRQVNNGLFEVVVFETQNLLGLGVVDFIQLDTTQTRVGLPNGHPVFGFRDLLRRISTISVVPLNDEKALASRLRQLARLQVGLRHIAHIHPRPERLYQNRVNGLRYKQHKLINVGGEGVKLSQISGSILVWSVNHGWTDGGNVE